MASVFKRSIWLHPATGKACRKDTPGAKPARSRVWYYKVIGDKRSYSGYTDKTATAAKATEHEKRLARGEQGLIDRFSEHRKCSLSNHADDFVNDLKTKQRDSMYVYTAGRILKRLIEECTWTNAASVTPDSFVKWRQKQNLAPKSLNEYLAFANGLFNWMVKHDRLQANPLRHVGKVEARGKERRVRRALTDPEVIRLLSCSGPRKPVYLLALITGLRKDELAHLHWADLHLDAVRPFLTVRASISKNHKSATILLRDDAVQELRTLRSADSAVDDDPVFRTMPTIYRFKKDLVHADIAYKDNQGRQADFHALRHTFATNLARAGINPRICMELMRHSDMKLTTKVYTDTTMLATGDAVEALPRWNTPATSNQENKATGTDDQAISPSLGSTIGSTINSAFSCSGPRQAALGSAAEPVRKTIKNIGNSHENALIGAGLQEGGKNWGTRIRTLTKAGPLQPNFQARDSVRYH